MLCLLPALLLTFSVGAKARSLELSDFTEDGPIDLTPYIERGDVEKARNMSAVDPTLFAGVRSHAGHITGNKTKKWHLFFWFFPVENKPLESTPWLIWFQGGPGASSLFGLFTEIGPIVINKDMKVEKMPITWGSDYSLLFIDNPVQTGFSYSEDGSVAENEDEVGDTLLSFLEQFVQLFPELQKAPLFITGESYAGKFIPALGHYIHHRENHSIPINLKGLAIGDGWTDPPSLTHFSEWGVGTGLIDFKTADQIRPYEEAARKYWAEGNIEKYKEIAAQVLNSYSILQTNVYNYMSDFMPPQNYGSFKDYITRPDIRKAIHVGDLTYREFNIMLINDIYLSVKPWLEELLEHYGVMVYNGQLDVIVAYGLSMYTYKSLKWSGQEAYYNTPRKTIWGPTAYNNHTVLGYEKSYGNLMDVLVLGAGHMVPADQPRSAKIIIDMFINKFKGLAIGDGFTDPPSLTHFSEWGVGTGLYDFKTADELRPYEEAARKYWAEGNIEKYKETVNSVFSSFDQLKTSYYNYMSAFMPPRNYGSYEDYITRPDIRKALHVGDLTYRDLNMNMLRNEFYLSVKPWLEELLEHYGVMVYNGQLDVIVAYGLSMHTYKSLKWSGQEAYYNTPRKYIYGPTAYTNHTVLGYEKSYGNLMDVLVLGAGHMVPADQPRSAKIIIDMFINKFK